MDETTKATLKVQQLFQSNGTVKKLLKATKSDWISKLIYLDGKPFSFKGRDYLFPIYNTKYKKKLLLCGRQVEKTTSLANEIIIQSVLTPYLKTLYISPSHLQSRQFSNGKLRPWIEDSPIISKYFLNSSTSAQVFERGLSNGSMCWIRSAFLNADRARGLSADLLCLDEVQDLLTSNIQVIEECLSHAEDPQEILSGTPKSLDNPIQQHWDISSQCEWLVPCDHHIPQHWNYLDEKCLGKDGPICNKCGNRIDPKNGKWIAFSNTRDLIGYRISQLMVPWYQNPDKWKELLYKHTHLSKGVFYNECLGISFDSSSKPITRTELVSCCSSTHPFRYQPDGWTKRMEIFAGIDWGEGTDGSEKSEKGRLKHASYTVLSLGTYLSPKSFHYFYYKRFEGKEAHPTFCVDEIIRILRAFNVRCVGSDWGHGWGVNSRLEEVFGVHKIIQFQHVGIQGERKKYNEAGNRYQLSRTEVMSDFFSSIKKQEIVWPNWEASKDFLCDIENIYAEYTDQKALKYDHRASNPDDACHSSIYCREAADNYYGIGR